MKKQIIAVLVCIVCIVCGVQFFGLSRNSGENEAFKALEAAEEKYIKFMPKINAIEEDKANDLEVQLGTALLDDTIFTAKRKTRESQYKNVLKIDPDNEIAWAVKTKRLCQGYTARRRALIENLDLIITLAKKRNVDELKIPSCSTTMLGYFNEKDKGVIKVKPRGAYSIIITDMDIAPKILIEKLDKEGAVVLKELNKAEERHFKNALYNYLKAHFYFRIGEQDKALGELEKAVEKPYLSNYYNESTSARKRVLAEIDFPEPHRSFITGFRMTTFRGFISGQIWEEGLANIAEDYEKKGDLKKAQKMYEIGIKMASQEEKDFGRPSHLKQKIKVKSSKLKKPK